MVPILVGPLSLLALLASVLVGTDRLAFRDVSYFYTPLYDYVAKRGADQPGGVFGAAIWNPLDLTGMPLAGETTTAVFYPIRMLVYAAGWTAETSMGVYVVIHLILASLSAYWLARTYRCRPWSAAMAGIVYPLSGTVLFLATNPPFLVSAAWLPFLLGSLLRPNALNVAQGFGFTARSVLGWDGIPLAASAMAMMILGGDPSTAFHAALILSSVSVFSFFTKWLVQQPAIRDRCGSLIGRTIVTCVIAAVLSAPQIAASVDWSRQSDRVSIGSEHPTQRSVAMAFSFPVWRLVEFGMPNLYGTPWPVHHRWDRIALDRGGQRPDTALWTPTVYVGTAIWMFIALLITRSIARIGRVGFKRFVSQLLRSDLAIDWWIIGLVGMLASMGSYTPLYSLMMDWIPGYDALRYPSKWLPFVTLSLALGLARGSDMLSHLHRAEVWRPSSLGTHWHATQWPSLLCPGLIVLLVVVLTVLGLVLNGLPNESGVHDYYWGPFRKDVAMAAFLETCCHLFVVLVGLAVSNWFWGRAESSVARQRYMSLFVISVAMDLVVAHHDLVPRINRIEERQRIQASPDLPDGSRWMNTLPRGGASKRWQTASSDDRMVEVEAALRSSWFGRWHLEHSQAKFNSLVSIRPAQIAQFWAMTRQATANQTSRQRQSQWDQWLSELNIVGSITRQDDQIHWVRTNGATHAEEQVMTGFYHSIQVHFKQPTTIRRAVYQDGHWTATATAVGSSEVPPMALTVEPEIWLSQSIEVPAGDWQIDWRYSPGWFFPSIAIALLAWLSLVTYILWRAIRLLQHLAKLPTGYARPSGRR